MKLRVMISDILKAKGRWLSVDLNNSYQAGPFSVKESQNMSYKNIN